jgi:hypothetical protein
MNERRRPGRFARWRFRVFWRLLGPAGREHVVSSVLEQIAEAEALARDSRARAAALADPMVGQVLADLATKDPELAQAEAARLGIPFPTNGD